MPKETAERRAARLAVYQAYSESGQTITEFSKERGISYWKVKGAVKKTEGEGSERNFQEVAVTPLVMGGGYAVILRNGRELRLPVHFTENRVRKLLEILETC
jgi:hypothetical protein